MSAIESSRVECFGRCGAVGIADSFERRGRVYVNPPRGWYMATEEDGPAGNAFLCDDCAERDGTEPEPSPVKVCDLPSDVCPCRKGFAVHG